MFARSLVTLCLAMAACGPGQPGDATSDPASTTGAPATEPAPTSGESTVDPTTDGPAEEDSTAGHGSTGGTTGAPASDEQLCETWCANAVAQDCRDSADCLAYCLETFMYSELMGCGAEQRAVTACEGTQTLDFMCYQSSACASVYAPFDACYFGDCVGLGAGRTSSVGPDECTWGALFCYGHDFEMKCPATDDPQCTCSVDGVEVSTCALGADLEPNVCSDAFATFMGCCTEVFLAAV